MTNVNDVPFHEMGRRLQALDDHDHTSGHGDPKDTARHGIKEGPFGLGGETVVDAMESSGGIFADVGRPGWTVNLWNGRDGSCRYLRLDDGWTIYSRQPEEDPVTGDSNIPNWFGRWMHGPEGEIYWTQLTVVDGISASWPDSCLFVQSFLLLRPELQDAVRKGMEPLPCKMDVDRLALIQFHGDRGDNGVWLTVYEGWAMDLEETQELFEDVVASGGWDDPRLEALKTPIPGTYSDFRANGVVVPADVMDWLTDEDIEPDEDAVGHAGAGVEDLAGDADPMDGDSVEDARREDGVAAPHIDGDGEDLSGSMNDGNGWWSPSSWLELPPFLR